MPDQTRTTFEKAAGEHVEKGILVEWWHFMRHGRKLWMIPIVVMLLVFGLLIFLSGTGIAPLIYTLF
jgi:hypothetical protein